MKFVCKAYLVGRGDPYPGGGGAESENITLDGRRLVNPHASRLWVGPYLSKCGLAKIGPAGAVPTPMLVLYMACLTD